jgi:hypothetical protein
MAAAAVPALAAVAVLAAAAVAAVVILVVTAQRRSRSCDKIDYNTTLGINVSTSFFGVYCVLLYRSLLCHAQQHTVCDSCGIVK